MRRTLSQLRLLVLPSPFLPPQVELVADSLDGMEKLVAALAKSTATKGKRDDIKLRVNLAEVYTAG